MSDCGLHQLILGLARWSPKLTDGLLEVQDKVISCQLITITRRVSKLILDSVWVGRDDKFSLHDSLGGGVR